MQELNKIAPGKTVVVKKLQGDKRFLSRVISIGIAVGCPLEVLQNVRKCPVLVYGRDTMIALNRIECEKIIVEEVIS